MAETIKTVVVDRPGVTPADANIVPVALRPVAAVLVRVARTYVQALLGFLVVLGMGEAALAGGVAPQTFADALARAAGYALAPAVVALIWNAGELLARLDETRPEIRG